MRAWILMLVLAGCAAQPGGDEAVEEPVPQGPVDLAVRYDCQPCASLEVAPDPRLTGLVLQGGRAAVTAAGWLADGETGWQAVVWVRDGQWTMLPTLVRPDSDEPIPFPMNSAGVPAFVGDTLLVPMTLEDRFPPTLGGGNVMPEQINQRPEIYLARAAPPYADWDLSLFAEAARDQYGIAAFGDGAVAHQATEYLGSRFVQISVPDGDAWTTTTPADCAWPGVPAAGDDGWYIDCGGLSSSDEVRLLHLSLHDTQTIATSQCETVRAAAGGTWAESRCPGAVLHTPDGSLPVEGPWAAAWHDVIDIDVDAHGQVHLLVLVLEDLADQMLACDVSIHHVVVAATIVHDAVIASRDVAECYVGVLRAQLAEDDGRFVIAVTDYVEESIAIVEGTIGPS